MIRRAEIQDAGGIARVHVNTWKTAYAGIVSAAYLESLSIDDRTSRWKQSIEKAAGHTYVAVCEGRIVGWMCFGPSRDEDGRESHEVYAVYVEHQSWGRGIGRQLMNKAESVLLSEKRADITLWVLEENHPSLAFYDRVGYVPDGKKKTQEIGGKALSEVRLRKRIDER